MRQYPKTVILYSIVRGKDLFYSFSQFLIITLPFSPKTSPSLSAGPVVVSFCFMGSPIWKGEILMTNPDPSMSCCSNHPAFSFTLLCVSGSGWGRGWCCVSVCARVRVCVCLCRCECLCEEAGGWGLVGSMCAKARLMLCVATEYK